MYKLNKFIAPAAIAISSVIALVMLSPSANAGLDLIAESKKKDSTKKKAQGKTRPTKVKTMARIPDNKPTDSFKCWQEGRLIFQRHGLEVKKQELPGAAMIKANGKSVQVLDLKQGVCILDQAVK